MASPSALALRGGLGVEDAVLVPPAVQGLSKRIGGALTSAASRVGKAASAVQPHTGAKAAAARLSTNANGDAGSAFKEAHAGAGIAPATPVLAAAVGQQRSFSTGATDGGREPLTVEPRSREDWAALGREELKALRKRVEANYGFDHSNDKEWKDLAEAFSDANLVGRLGESWSEVQWLKKLIDSPETTATLYGSGKGSITGEDWKGWMEQALSSLRQLAAEPIGAELVEPTLDDPLSDEDRMLWKAAVAEVRGVSNAVADALAKLEQERDEKDAALASPAPAMTPSSPSSASSAAAAKLDFYRSPFGTEEMNANVEIESVGATHLVDDFLLALQRNRLAESVWQMWREFRENDLPSELQNDESVDAIEGAFVTAVVNSPDVATLIAGVVQGLIREAREDAKSLPADTMDLNNWMGRLDSSRDMLLRWTALSEDKAVHFGRWVEAWMLVEDVGADFKAPAVDLTTLREMLTFAEDHHVNEDEVLRELKSLNAAVPKLHKQRSDRINHAVQRLRHLGEADVSMTAQ